MKHPLKDPSERLYQYIASVRQGYRSYPIHVLLLLIFGPLYLAAWYSSIRGLQRQTRRLVFWVVLTLTTIWALAGTLAILLLPAAIGEETLLIIASIYYLPIIILVSAAPLVFLLYNLKIARNWNQLLDRSVKVNYFLACVLGPLYFQYRLNQFSSPGTKALGRQINGRLRVLFLFGLWAMFSLIGAWWLGSNAAELERDYYLSQVTSEQRVFGQKIDATDDGLIVITQTNAAVIAPGIFQEVCADILSEDSLELGCYDPNTYQLFVLDIADTTLESIEDATLAHEILHHVYETMSSEERSAMDVLTAAEAARLSGNEQLASLTDAYADVDEETYRNELHSLLAVVDTPLSSELEAHYGTYFDRALVRAAEAQYRESFEAVENALAAKEAELSSLETRIQAYDNRLTNLDRQMEYWVAIDDYQSYNSQVPVFNNLISQMESLIAEYDTLYALYDEQYTAYGNLYDGLELGEPSDITSLIDKY